MKSIVPRLRRLQWKLTLSYTLVTVSALLVLGLIALVFSFMTSVSDAASRSVTLGIVSNRVAEAAAPFLTQSPPDATGLQRRLLELRSLSPALSRVPSLDDRWADGQGPIILVLSTDGSLLGSLPPMADQSAIGRPLDTHRVPGLADTLAIVQEGQGRLDYTGATTSGDRALRVTAILGGDRSLLGLVVSLAGPAAFLAGPWDVVSNLLTMVLALTAGAAVIGSLFGFITARTLSRRIGNLAAVAGAWSRGDFGVWLDDRSGDEVGQLARQMNRTAEQLQNLLRMRQELATLKERERLARDLHDSVKQQVFATAMQLGAAAALLEQDRGAAREHLVEAQALTRQAQKELALLIQELRPVDLEGRGLSVALREYAANWSRQTGIALAVSIDAGGGLTSEMESALFRVAQEALANVARHSGARSAKLELACGADQADLSIGDDGVGFDPAARRGQGVGLASMRERIEALGGELSVESAPERGTTVSARCPFVVLARSEEPGEVSIG